MPLRQLVNASSCTSAVSPATCARFTALVPAEHRLCAQSGLVHRRYKWFPNWLPKQQWPPPKKWPLALKFFVLLVPGGGGEPPRPCDRRILRPNLGVLQQAARQRTDSHNIHIIKDMLATAILQDVAGNGSSVGCKHAPEHALINGFLKERDNKNGHRELERFPVPQRTFGVCSVTTAFSGSLGDPGVWKGTLDKNRESVYAGA